MPLRLVVICFSYTNREITKNGYVYIYVSNQTPNVNVFWDNLQVTHIRGPLLQENGYYPFGGEIRALTTNAGGVANRHKFNAGTELNEFFDIDLYETPFRRYDATTGRFTGVDAMAEVTMHLTPYQFGANSPVMYNDPTGLIAMGMPKYKQMQLEMYGSESFYFSNPGGDRGLKFIQKFLDQCYANVWETIINGSAKSDAASGSGGSSDITEVKGGYKLTGKLAMLFVMVLQKSEKTNNRVDFEDVDRLARLLFDGNHPEIKKDHRRNSFAHIMHVLAMMVNDKATAKEIRKASRIWHEGGARLEKNKDFNGHIEQNRDDADTIADLLNNRIAYKRYAAISSSKPPDQQPAAVVALWTLNIMLHEGFWGVTEVWTANGKAFQILFKRLDISIYNEAIKRLNNL